MTVAIKITPTEMGTAVIEMTFTDEAGELVSPANLRWQLMLPDGSIVNDRTFALCPFSALNGIAVVALTGLDLAIINGNKKRIFSIQGTYDSTAGSGLSITDEISFSVRALLGQANIIIPDVV